MFGPMKEIPLFKLASQRDKEDIKCSSGDGGADRALNGRVYTTPSTEISSV